MRHTLYFDSYSFRKRKMPSSPMYIIKINAICMANNICSCMQLCYTCHCCQFLPIIRKRHPYSKH